MSYQALNFGTVVNDGTGDTLPVAADKINDNFVEIYGLLGDGTSLSSGISATATVVTLTAPTISGVVGGTITSATITTLTGTTFNAGTLALAAGSITDSSGAISFGNENLTTTGSVTAASLDISGNVDIDGTLETDALTINGTTLAETISDTVGAMVNSNTETNITVTYDDADNTLDFVVGTLNQSTSGNAATATALETARTIGGTSFDGTANIAVALSATATALANARTIHGVSFDGTANIDLTEVIEDTVGTMVASNTETGITVTYQDSDGTFDFALSAAQTTITSLLATDIKIGEDDQTKIDFETADTINFYAGNEKQLILTDGALTPGADNILDLGSSGVEFKDGYFDGTVTADAFAGPLTGNVTGNASGSAATVTTAAQSAITSLGTLTTLTVDNVITNGTTIGHTDDTDLMTLADGILTVAGEISVTTLDIGGTNVTATAAELNFSDGVTSNVQTQMDTKTTKGFAIASAIVFG